MSTHLALQLCCKDLKMFLTPPYSQFSKHHGEWWDGKGEIVWVDNAFPNDITERLSLRKYRIRIESSR